MASAEVLQAVHANTAVFYDDADSPNNSSNPSETKSSFQFNPHQSLLKQGQILHELQPNHPLANSSGYKHLILSSPSTILESYTGDIVNHLPEGNGTAVFKSKAIYTGEFKEGLMHGSGRIQWNDDIEYEGEFYHNSVTGMGRIIWKSTNCEYSGSVSDGLRDGYGVYRDPIRNCFYSGQWKQGLKHGHGRLVYGSSENSEFSSEKNIGVYEGQFSKGVRQGEGYLVYPSGNYYTGHWENDKKSGYGEMHYLTKSEIYKGSWSNNEPNGIGEYSWLSIPGLKALLTSKGPRVQTHFQVSNRYIGSFVNGIRQGYGRFYYANGSCYCGNWSNNKKEDSNGLFIFENGAQYKGSFTDDQMDNRTFTSTETTMIDLPIQDLLHTVSTEVLTFNKNLHYNNSKKNNNNNNNIQNNIDFTAKLTAEMAQEKQFVTNLFLRYNTELLDIYKYYSLLDNNSELAGLTMNLTQFWQLLYDIGIDHNECSIANINRLALKYYENIVAVQANEDNPYLYDVAALIPTADGSTLQSVHSGNMILLYRNFAELLVSLAHLLYEVVDVEGETNNIPLPAAVNLVNSSNNTNSTSTLKSSSLASLAENSLTAANTNDENTNTRPLTRLVASTPNKSNLNNLNTGLSSSTQNLMTLANSGSAGVNEFLPLSGRLSKFLIQSLLPRAKTRSRHGNTINGPHAVKRTSLVKLLCNLNVNDESDRIHNKNVESVFASICIDHSADNKFIHKLKLADKTCNLRGLLSLCNEKQVFTPNFTSNHLLFSLNLYSPDTAFNVSNFYNELDREWTYTEFIESLSIISMYEAIVNDCIAKRIQSLIDQKNALIQAEIEAAKRLEQEKVLAAQVAAAAAHEASTSSLTNINENGDESRVTTSSSGKSGNKMKKVSSKEKLGRNKSPSTGTKKLSLGGASNISSKSKTEKQSKLAKSSSNQSLKAKADNNNYKDNVNTSTVISHSNSTSEVLVIDPDNGNNPNGNSSQLSSPRVGGTRPGTSSSNNGETNNHHHHHNNVSSGSIEIPTEFAPMFPPNLQYREMNLTTSDQQTRANEIALYRTQFIQFLEKLV